MRLMSGSTCNTLNSPKPTYKRSSPPLKLSERPMMVWNIVVWWWWCIVTTVGSMFIWIIRLESTVLQSQISIQRTLLLMCIFHVHVLEARCEADTLLIPRMHHTVDSSPVHILFWETTALGFEFPVSCDRMTNQDGRHMYQLAAYNTVAINDKSGREAHVSAGSIQYSGN